MMTPGDMSREQHEDMCPAGYGTELPCDCPGGPATPSAKDMAHELRAAGWTLTPRGLWLHPIDDWNVSTLEEAWQQLARRQETGTVVEPVVGQEEET